MTQFTVDHIWPFDPAKKSGGFKGTDGMNYYCEPGAYHMLVKGATYNAEIKEYVSKAGKKSWIVDKKFHPPAALVGALPAQATSSPTDMANHPASQTQQSLPNPAIGASRYQNEEDIKSRRIFVTGVVQQAMGTGKFAPADIAILVEEAVRAWKAQGL